MVVTVSLKDMVKNGVHFGHKASRWNPKMKKYIFGKRSGLHIIDLEKTADLFAHALDFIYNTIVEGKTILFVATKLQTSEILKDYAKASKTPYIINRWLGGTLTNFKTIKDRVRYFKKLTSQIESGELGKYTKKEQAQFQKQLATLEKSFGGVQDMDELPGVIFVTDINADRIAIEEAKKMHIPVVGFADTNADPTLVDYPIPANDDAIHALQYLLGIVNEVVVDARSKAKVKKVQEEKKKEIEISEAVITEKEEGIKKKAPMKKVIKKVEEKIEKKIEEKKEIKKEEKKEVKAKEEKKKPAKKKTASKAKK